MSHRPCVCCQSSPSVRGRSGVVGWSVAGVLGLGVVGMLAWSLAGGSGAAGGPGAGASGAATPTVVLAASPTKPASAQPLTIVFQKQKDPTAIKDKAQELADLLGQKLGRSVVPVVPTEYAASVQALVSKRADVAYVSVVPFLLAQRDGGAELILAEQRPDLTGAARTTYDAVLVARAESPLTSLEDLARQARELRMAWTSSTSTSGYIMPLATLMDKGIVGRGQDAKEVFASVHFAGSYTQALRAVLAGQADVAAVSGYTVEGPTREAYLPAEDQARLRVIARFPNVPTHVLCVRGGMDAAERDAISRALRELAQERPQLLAEVYGAAALVEVDPEAHVAPAREALRAIGLDVERVVR